MNRYNSAKGNFLISRRNFLGKAGCGLAGVALTAPLTAGGRQEQQVPPPPPSVTKPTRYKFEIEIYEARKDSGCHKQGDKFEYPADMGKICPWLLSSLHDVIILLQKGVTLSWKYEGTPYEKVIDPNGVTTEYVRCPDPTSNLVAKITRKKIS